MSTATRAGLIARREARIARIREEYDAKLAKLDREQAARRLAVRSARRARHKEQVESTVARHLAVEAIAERVAKAAAAITLSTPSARALLSPKGGSTVMSAARAAVAILARRQAIPFKTIAAAMRRATPTVYQMVERVDEPMVARILAAASEVQP